MSVNINSSNFPDEIFRNFVKNNIANGSDILNDSLINYTFDIDVGRLGISNLKGIEFFSALRNLYCHYNSIPTLDLSKNLTLSHVEASNQSIKHVHNLDLIETDDSTFPYKLDISKIVGASHILNIKSISANDSSNKSNFQNDGFLWIGPKDHSVSSIFYTYNTGFSDGVLSVNVLLDPYISSRSLNNATKGSNYKYTLKVNSSTTTPITWSIVSGALPPGLSLDPSSGIISGTTT